MFGDFFRYWDELPEQGGFSLFGWIHMGWLVGIVSVCLVVSHRYRRVDAATQDKILKILATASICLESLKDIYLILIGEMGISYLPFEMCGLAIFVELGFAFFHREFLGEIMCVISMPGAMAALLFPDWTRYPLFNYMHINSFLIHGLLVLIPVLVLTSGRYKPSIKRIWQIFFVLVYSCSLCLCYKQDLGLQLYVPLLSVQWFSISVCLSAAWLCSISDHVCRYSYSLYFGYIWNTGQNRFLLW